MIYKTEFKITILSEDQPFEVDQGYSGDPFDLLLINSAITDGDCVGNVESLGSSVVPQENVEKELIALGNDGTFFNRDESDEL